MEVNGRRIWLNMISAVSPRGEFRSMLHDSSVNAEVFCELLKRLMIVDTMPVFLIVDGHPLHKAKLVKKVVEDQVGKVKLCSTCHLTRRI